MQIERALGLSGNISKDRECYFFYVSEFEVPSFSQIFLIRLLLGAAGISLGSIVTGLQNYYLHETLLTVDWI